MAQVVIGPAVRYGVPAATAIAAAAAVAAFSLHAAFLAWAVALFAGVAALTGLVVAWRLGRRPAPEIEDVLSSAMAVAVIAWIVTFVVFVALQAALGGGQ